MTHVQSHSQEVGSGDEGLGLFGFDLSSAEKDFWWLEDKQFASHFHDSYDILCSSRNRSSSCFQHVPTTVVVHKQPSQSIHTSREA